MGKFAVLMRKENGDFENSFYVNAIKKFGGEVVFVYDDENRNDVYLKLALVEGILLTGGNDVGRLDFDLIEYALENELKILGICLGMQSMALYHTNNKLEDIGSNKHYQKEGYIHKVILFPSKVKKLLESNFVYVNSYHYQTVVGSEEFLIVGRSEDGLIEVVESNNDVFQVGVQWHPERMLEYDDASNKLISCFVKS